MHIRNSRFIHASIQAIARKKTFCRENKIILQYRHDSDILKSSFTTQRHLCSAEEDNILRTSFSDVTVPNVSFPSFLWDDNADSRGENIALVCL